jgi:hypothetical protein
MVGLSPLLIPFGLFLPGFFVARRLGHSLWWASSFVISLLILFQSVFWLGIFRVPITVWTVGMCLAAVSGAGAWWARRQLGPMKGDSAPRWALPDRILIVSSGLVGACLLVRCAASPLLGYDTRFRWDFLAERILALRTFHFYPPITPADFRTYFYPDGIPPLVSFSDWWIYASSGGHHPALICVFAAAQFACTLAFAYGAASALISRRAGVLATALLAGCPLYFNSVVIEQETGLTALSIAAMTYFLATTRKPDDAGGVVSAGLAAALCPLAREYGWIAPVAGVIALLWKKQPRKQTLIFAAVTATVAGPWYLRNLVLSGNPFFSLRFGPFPVNPVHDGILQLYDSILGVQSWTSDNWADIIFFLLPLAPLQLLAGIPGAFRGLRERGYLCVIAALAVAVWVRSVGYTAAGAETSTRVLSPMLVALSITAAGVLERFRRSAVWIALAVILCQGWTIAQGSVSPVKLSELSFEQWKQYAFKPLPTPPEFQIRGQLAEAAPRGTRMLSDGALMHAALIDKGIEIVPVWSPEVRFLFSSPAEESERRLRSLGIETVVYYPKSMNTRYLASASPFYASLPQRWRVVADVPDVFTILRPQ